MLLVVPDGLRILLIGKDPILERLHVIYEDWEIEVLHIHEWTSEDLMVSMADFRPLIVINGSTTESDRPDAFIANSRDPSIISLYSTMSGARMYHLSDSMVFSGRTEMGTDDPAFPVNVFGLSRYLGEQGVLSFGDATVVRVGWLYGQEIQSCPPMIAVDQAQGLRKSALIYSDMFGSPTFIGDAAVILAHHTIMFGPASAPATRPSRRTSIGFERVVHLAPTRVESWADLLEPSYPNVTPTTVRTSVKFRNLRRNAGLKPSMGWVVPAGGLSRFQDDLAGEWDFNNTVGTTEWWKEMYGES